MLDVSAEGISVRGQQKIPPGTAIHIELIVGDRRFGLLGQVMNSSGFPGNVRLGIRLGFADTGE